MLLTDRQRAMLEDTVHSRRRPHDEVQRATIILQSADGARTRHLAEALRVSDPTVRLWRRRWAQAGLTLTRSSKLFFDLLYSDPQLFSEV
jgi:transposase-like protein